MIVNKDGSIETKLGKVTIVFKGFHSNLNIWNPDSIRIYSEKWSMNIAFFPSKLYIHKGIDCLDLIANGPSININFIKEPNIVKEEICDWEELFKV